MSKRFTSGFSGAVLQEHGSCLRDIGLLCKKGEALHMAQHASHALARCNSQSEADEYRLMIKQDMEDCLFCNGRAV